MSKHYAEIMEHLVVTEEMRRRILKKICAASPVSVKKPMLFPRWKQILPLAACITVLAVGAWFAGRMAPPRDAHPPVTSGQTVSSCASAEELSQALGFAISDLRGIPFEKSSTAYTDLFGQIGQIQIEGPEGQQAIYRKSTGADDNSGNYEVFKTEKQINIDGVCVTLKGNDGQIMLAWWVKGDKAYSLSMTPGWPQAVWEKLLKQNIGS